MTALTPYESGIKSAMEAAKADMIARRAEQSYPTPRTVIVVNAGRTPDLPPDGPAPFELGDRIIDRERPDHGSVTVTGMGASSRGTWIASYADRHGGTGFGPARQYIRVSPSWREPPQRPMPAFSKLFASTPLDRKITQADMDWATSRDHTPDALQADLDFHEAYAEWFREYVLPLDPAGYEARYLAAQTRREWAEQAWRQVVVERMAAE